MSIGLFANNPTGRTDQSLRNYRFSSRKALKYWEICCSFNAARELDVALMKQVYKDPTQGPHFRLGLGQDSWLETEIWEAESQYRKKNNTRPLLICNWLCSASFWMKGASAEDNSPPIRLINTLWQTGNFLENDSLKFAIYADKHISSFSLANPQMIREETPDKRSNCTLERNQASGGLQQPPLSQELFYCSQVLLCKGSFPLLSSGLNTFLSCLFRRNFRGCLAFQSCFWIAWCMSQH